MHQCTIPVRFYEFTEITVERCDVYSPDEPSVCCIVRMVALHIDPEVTFDENRNRKRDKDILSPPTWFAVRIYWDALFRGVLGNNKKEWRVPAVDASYKEIEDYLTIHPHPRRTEEYDPILLEIR